MANFLAPVASESDMGGPLGWIAGFMDGIFDWVLEVGTKYFSQKNTRYKGFAEHDGSGRVLTEQPVHGLSG